MIVDDCDGKKEIFRVWIKTQYKKFGETKWQPVYKDGSEVEKAYPYTSFGDVSEKGAGGDFPGQDVTGVDFKSGDYRISVEVNGNNASKKTMEFTFYSGADRDLQGCDGCEGPKAMDI